MKCKNIECENETTGKRVYCSLTCRNIFVNKYLRNYDKVSDNFKKKKKEKEKEYLKNVKRCKFCNKDIPYDSRENDYCNHSCSASHNNSLREYTWGDKISESVKEYISKNGLFGALLFKKEKSTKFMCKNCNKEHEKRTVFCSNECLKQYRRINMDEYKKYKQDTIFKFSLNDYPDYFEFELIEKYGWYSPSNKNNNLNGVSRDHMISVKEGFELGIDPFLLAHPANCKLMIHNENISKNKKSSITLDELLDRITKFESIFGKY
jgi:hypothetical protein